MREGEKKPQTPNPKPLKPPVAQWGLTMSDAASHHLLRFLSLRKGTGQLTESCRPGCGGPELCQYGGIGWLGGRIPSFSVSQTPPQP